MKITVEITLEDLVAFNNFHLEHSPSTNRNKILRYVLTTVLIINAVLAIIKGQIFTTIVFILLAIFVIFLWKKVFKYFVSRQVKAMYKEGKNQGTIGCNDMTIGDDAIVQENASGSYMTKWNYVEKVLKTERFILVYNSAVSAYIIPRRSFIDNISYNDFYDLIVQKKSIAS
jgi:YcxB-like protein